MSAPADLRALIRDIPDFPKPGIVFKDITPLLLDPHAVDTAVEGIAEWARPRDVDFVVAAEARGFILGAAIARELGAGFVPARKPGKLPAEVVTAEYILEYGIDALEMHADALAARRARADPRRPARDGRHGARAGRARASASAASSSAARSSSSSPSSTAGAARGLRRARARHYDGDAEPGEPPREPDAASAGRRRNRPTQAACPGRPRRARWGTQGACFRPEERRYGQADTALLSPAQNTPTPRRPHAPFHVLVAPRCSCSTLAAPAAAAAC